MRAIIAAAMAALIGLAATAVAAEDIRAGDIEIATPWSRATASTMPNGASYMVLSNHGSQADRLVAAATPVAEQAQLHFVLVDEGVMRMRPVAAIEVAPGEPSVLQPGGLHIMLLGLKAPLKRGSTFPLILTFERAGAVEVQVTVQSAGATTAPAAAHGHGHGQPDS